MPITKQTIAIIGAGGYMGSAIAKSISSGNYRLLLFSDDVSSVQPLAEEMTQSDSSADIDVRDCKFEACWEADIIIMAVPYSAQEKVVEIIKDVATQKIVVSLSSKTGAAEELQELLPNSKIVKAINIDFNQLNKDKQADVFIAGDDNEALETVLGLIQTAGLNPVIAGDLSIEPEMKKL